MIVHLAWLQPLDSFQRLPYVCESKRSSIIFEFRLGVEGLGNKNPRTGYNRKQFCPVYPQLQPNSGIHLLFLCSSLSRLRVDTGITSFLTACTVHGVPLNEAYHLFIRDEFIKKNGKKNDIVHFSNSPHPPGLIVTSERVTNHIN